MPCRHQNRRRPTYEVPRNADTLSGKLPRTTRRPPVTDWPARADEVGIELISEVQRQVSHSQYFVVETEDYAKPHELFMTFQGISTAEFTPVRDLMDL